MGPWIASAVFSALLSLEAPSTPAPGGGEPIPQLRIYSHPRTRGPLIAWYLRELQVPFEDRLVAFEQQEQKGNDFLTLNPFAQVPVLEVLEEDGKHIGLTLYESGAILMYLSEVYGELSGGDSIRCQLPPEWGSGPMARAQIAKWIYFANSSLSNKITQGSGRKNSPGWRIAMTPSLQVLEKVLEESSTGFLDSCTDLTAADVAVASLLLYTPEFHPGEYSLLKDFPQVVNYMERMSSRSAYRETYGEEYVQNIMDTIEGYRNPSRPRPATKFSLQSWF